MCNINDKMWYRVVVAGVIKATRLHPGVPLQVYMEGMVVAEVVVEGVVEVESVMVKSDVVVSVDMVVKATVAAITELAIRLISFFILSLSSAEAHS